MFLPYPNNRFLTSQAPGQEAIHINFNVIGFDSNQAFEPTAFGFPDLPKQEADRCSTHLTIPSGTIVVDVWLVKGGLLFTRLNTNLALVFA